LCVCGSINLYDEWVKQNETGEKEEASTSAKQADNQISPSNTSGNGDANTVQTKK
jgi:hypothetical protein